MRECQVTRDINDVDALNFLKTCNTFQSGPVNNIYRSTDERTLASRIIQNRKNFMGVSMGATVWMPCIGVTLQNGLDARIVFLQE